MIFTDGGCWCTSTVQYICIRGVVIVALFYLFICSLFSQCVLEGKKRKRRKKKPPLISVSIFRTLRETMEKNQENKAKYGDAIVKTKQLLHVTWAGHDEYVDPGCTCTFISFFFFPPPSRYCVCAWWRRSRLVFWWFSSFRWGKMWKLAKYGARRGGIWSWILCNDIIAW